jgi:hypothetical protein
MDRIGNLIRKASSTEVITLIFGVDISPGLKTGYGATPIFGPQGYPV